jgi:hypothetical protein
MRHDALRRERVIKAAGAVPLASRVVFARSPFCNASSCRPQSILVWGLAYQTDFKVTMPRQGRASRNAMSLESGLAASTCRMALF